MREVLTILKRQLAHNAEENATELEGEPGKWTMATKEGVGAPVMYVFYTLSEGRCLLEYLALASGEPPGGDQDMTAL